MTTIPIEIDPNEGSVTIVVSIASADEPPAGEPPAEPPTLTGTYTPEHLLLEPMALEPLTFVGDFPYSVAPEQSRAVVNAWNVRMNGNARRFDLRDPRFPLPVRGVTIDAMVSRSCLVTLNPDLVVDPEPAATHAERRSRISTLQTHYLTVNGGGATSPFLAGPYGSIVTAVHVHDAPWLIATHRGEQGAWNLSNEIGDAGADDQRIGQSGYFPVSRSTLDRIVLGASGGPDPATGGLVFVHCPADWSKVPDPATYLVRWDGLAAPATLDWSISGSVGHDSALASAVITGNNTWAATGLVSTTEIANVAGRRFECDVYVPGTGVPNLIVGLSSGGLNYSDFVHGVDFTTTSSKSLQIFENGTDRGVVGSYSNNTLYRVAITLNGDGSAKYEMQGGPQFPRIGGESWADVSPSTSQASAASVRAAVSQKSGPQSFVGDVKVKEVG